MGTQDIPLKKELIEEKVKKTFGLSQLVMTCLFNSFLIVAVYFSLITSIIYLFNTQLLSSSMLGIKLLKLLFYFHVCSALIIILKIIYRRYLFSKSRMQQRRIKLKEEIKKEILKEINGKRKTR